MILVSELRKAHAVYGGADCEMAVLVDDNGAKHHVSVKAGQFHEGEFAVLGWSVVDQVMPLPYKVGSTQLDDESWIAGLDGTDGGSASGAVIRRHSTLRANGETTSSRLVGRSVWNDRWILVIPASSLNANRVRGLETFIKGVSDIKLAIKAYSRQGN